MRRGLVAIAVLTLVALSGCAQPVSGGVGAPGVAAPQLGLDGVDESALAGWRDFPVTAKPRPLVVTGGLSEVAGFTTDRAKIASLQGTFELTVPLPQGTPSPRTVQLPDGPATLKLISAEVAWQRVSHPPNAAPVDASIPPLKILKVELGTQRLLTDRGPVTVPAWLFHPAESLGPITWSALDPAAYWPTRPDDGTFNGGFDNRLAADGVTLTLQLAAPSPPCPGEQTYTYSVESVESPTAVAIGMRATAGPVAPGNPSQQCMHDLMFRSAAYTLTLDAPLGNRVLVGDNGHPLSITRG